MTSTTRTRLLLSSIKIAASLLVLFGATPSIAGAQSNQAAGNQGRFLRSSARVEGQYVVVLNVPRLVPGDFGTGRAHEAAVRLSTKHGAKVMHEYERALSGFSIHASETIARAIADEAEVAYVEEDSVVHVSGIETPLPTEAASSNAGWAWGLARIDQRSLPLDNSYTFDHTGAGVNVYVLDSGIYAQNPDFGGRAEFAANFIDNDSTDGFCALYIDNGEAAHGTHVAGIIGGTQYGVAKGVTLHAVRVTDCNGNSDGNSVIAGVEWVATSAVKPAVANMSLGGGPNPALDEAVSNIVADGITVVVAAGNGINGIGTDACTDSPADAAAAITVGASEVNSNNPFDGFATKDLLTPYSNWGLCVDLIAPGGGNGEDFLNPILSDWNGGPNSWDMDELWGADQGTSMAAPHVTGVVALYLQDHPTASPTQVLNALESVSTWGQLANDAPNGVYGGALVRGWFPNHLLYSRYDTVEHVALLRYFTPGGAGDHLYTTNWSELRAGGVPCQPIGSISGTTLSGKCQINGVQGWNYEGVQAYVAPLQQTGTIPFYRYYNSSMDKHFYTTNLSELGTCNQGQPAAQGYVCEGIAGYVLPAPSGSTCLLAGERRATCIPSGTTPLYRYRNVDNGAHFYTTNWSELGGGSGPWVYEGVQCLVWTSP